MAKVETAHFKFREDLDLSEHHNYTDQVLKDAIDATDAANHLPPRAWSWPTAAELRKMRENEPDPMIAINAMRRRLNPDPFRTLRRYLRTPRAKQLM
jgi:hypothetical protein